MVHDLWMLLSYVYLLCNKILACMTDFHFILTLLTVCQSIDHLLSRTIVVIAGGCIDHVLVSTSSTIASFVCILYITSKAPVLRIVTYN